MNPSVSPSPRTSAASAFPVTPAVGDPDPDPDPRIRTRREEAFTLYCQGYRSPAIASLLGVPQRTIRAWIAATLQQTADESRTRRDHQLRLAIESQRAIVQAAWHAYARAARAERLTLEHLQNAVPLNVDTDDDPLDLDSDPYGPPSPPQRRGGQGVRTLPPLPRLPTLGARYLQIVLHAQREIARLSGLYHLPDTFYDPNAGRPMQIVIRREAHLPREQRVAWTAFRQQWDAAHPDDPVPPDDLVFPPDGAPLHDYADPDDPDDPDDPANPANPADDPNDSADDLDDPDDPTNPDASEVADRALPGAVPAETSAADLPHDPALLAQCESAAETAIPASPANRSPDSRQPASSGSPDECLPCDADVRPDLQPAQAGFVAERPLGADSSAGPLSAPAAPSAGPLEFDSAAETAIPDPVPAGLHAPPAPSAATASDFSPPGACDGTSVPRSGAVPTTVHPSLLPRFRRRSGRSPLPAFQPLIRDAP